MLMTLQGHWSKMFLIQYGIMLLRMWHHPYRCTLCMWHHPYHSWTVPHTTKHYISSAPLVKYSLCPFMLVVTASQHIHPKFWERGQTGVQMHCRRYECRLSDAAPRRHSLRDRGSMSWRRVHQRLVDHHHLVHERPVIVSYGPWAESIWAHVIGLWNILLREAEATIMN
jgi:hypothetical protein